MEDPFGFGLSGRLIAGARPHSDSIRERMNYFRWRADQETSAGRDPTIWFKLRKLANSKLIDHEKRTRRSSIPMFSVSEILSFNSVPGAITVDTLIGCCEIYKRTRGESKPAWVMLISGWDWTLAVLKPKPGKVHTVELPDGKSLHVTAGDDIILLRLPAIQTRQDR